MRSRKPNKTLRFKLHAVAAVLLLTACGDEGSSPTAPPTPPTPVATSVTLSATSLSFSFLGETSELTATVTDQNGQAMSGAAVTWATSSSSVATVSSTGLVTSVADGNATITATSGSVSGTAAVTVAQVATLVSISPETTTLTSIGDTVTLRATVTDAGGRVIPGADSAVMWFYSGSERPDIITLSHTVWESLSSTNIVTSVGNGTAKIGGCVVEPDTGSPGPCISGQIHSAASVTVNQVVASLALADTSFSALGDTARAPIRLEDSNGNSITDISDVDWTTSNPTVVTVSDSGILTSVANGTATITASSGSHSATASVTVNQVASAITLSQNAIEFSVIGDTAQLSASVQDANGNDISGTDVVWATSDESIATVSSSGLVTAVAWGGVEITATAGTVEEKALVASMLGLEIRVVLASDTVNAGTHVEVAVEVYRSDTSNPVAGVTGSVTWAGVIGTFVENSASAPAWDGNLLTNADRVGRVQFAAASAAGVTGDPVEIIRFELRVDRIGTTQITPDLTELAVVDPVTGATTDVLDYVTPVIVTSTLVVR